MRQTQALGVEDEPIGPEKIEIDDAWPPAFDPGAAKARFDCEQRLEQLLRGAAVPDERRCVQELGLRRPADRGRSVAARHPLDAGNERQLAKRSPERRDAVAQIGAQSDDAREGGHAAQRVAGPGSSISGSVSVPA